VEIGQLRFFRLIAGNLQNVPVVISRTGYTGDLGYEIWLGAEHAERVWDALLATGKDFGIKPAGLLALDVARLEAGFILLEVDYPGADKAISPAQKYSPYEIGLGWTVDLKKDHFVGAPALRREQQTGSGRQIVGLEIDLAGYEKLYEGCGLPPQFPAAAWRSVVPLYRSGIQVGHATTGAWSPSLKKYLALATVRKDCASPGNCLEMEVLVEYSRKTTAVTVVPLPFFDPPRKRALFEKKELAA
jgi:aminomethyltransferase